MVKNPPAVWETWLGLIPGLGRSPGGGPDNPLQYSCLENPHGQRSLEGYSPWGRKELDTTVWLSTAQSLKIHFRKQGFPIYLKAYMLSLFFLSSGIYATKNILFLSSAIPLGFLTGVTWLSCTMPQPRGQFCLTISLWFLPFATYIFNQIVIISA